jgi:hypothetical protein
LIFVRSVDTLVRAAFHPKRVQSCELAAGGVGGWVESVPVPNAPFAVSCEVHAAAARRTPGTTQRI